MSNRILALASAGLVVAASCGGSTSPGPARTVRFTASLTTAGEVGSTLVGDVAASGGTFTAELDTVANVFRYSVSFAGMSSPVIGGHIHGPYSIGGGAATAEAILDLDPTGANTPLSSTATFGKGSTSGTGGGILELIPSVQISATVTGDSLAKLLLAGRTYVNIETSSNAGGEIRGQVSVVP